MNNLGILIETARQAQGMTQAELAQRLGVQQASIHRYEKGTRSPDTETLTRIGEVFGWSSRFVASASRPEGAIAVDAHLRRRATARPTVWRQLEATLNMHRLHAEFLAESVSVQSSRAIPSLDPVDATPQEAARVTRMQWRIPIGPVRDLVGWLESAGCPVIGQDMGTSRVDGLSQWSADLPLVMYNTSAPVDRVRWTLAHELGHLVLHRREVPVEVEDQANAFAAEFLMPEAVIRPQLRNFTLGSALDLKQEWGVSVQALVLRAHDLGVIDHAQRTRLYKQISYRQWRIREPGSDSLAPETPRLLRAIREQMSDLGLTDDEIAEAAGFLDSSRNTLMPAPARRLHSI